MLAALFLATTLIVGPEQPLTPDAAEQHSVAFAGKLAVWNEGGGVQSAIRGRFLPKGEPFTIAAFSNFDRSASSVATIDRGYVVAWFESQPFAGLRIIFQTTDEHGVLKVRREVAGVAWNEFPNPYDKSAAPPAGPAIASNGKTIALATGGASGVLLRLFDTSFEPISSSRTLTAPGDDLALVRIIATPPPLRPTVEDLHVVWNGDHYTVAWRFAITSGTVNYAIVDSRGVIGNAILIPGSNWLALATTAHGSKVVAAGTAYGAPKYDLCLEVVTLGAPTRDRVRCVPGRRASDALSDIKPALADGLLLISEWSGRTYDVLAAPIAPHPVFTCVSCTELSEQRPAATSFDGHTYVAYERIGRAPGNAMRLFLREVTVDRR